MRRAPLALWPARFTYDGNPAPKALKFNADTLTALLETAVRLFKLYSWESGFFDDFGRRQP